MLCSVQISIFGKYTRGSEMIKLAAGEYSKYINNGDTQLYMWIFESDQSNMYIAYRGTSSIGDIFVDLDIRAKNLLEILAYMPDFTGNSRKYKKRFLKL